jgi:hypothetical protein
MKLSASAILTTIVKRRMSIRESQWLCLRFQGNRAPCKHRHFLLWLFQQLLLPILSDPSVSTNFLWRHWIDKSADRVFRTNPCIYLISYNLDRSAFFGTKISQHSRFSSTDTLGQTGWQFLQTLPIPSKIFLTIISASSIRFSTPRTLPVGLNIMSNGHS